MASMASERFAGPSTSMARSAVAEAELEGWASIAEGMMAEAILVSLSDVQEPQARAALVAECAATQLTLVQRWLSAMPATPVPCASSSPPVPATTTKVVCAEQGAAAEARLAQVNAAVQQRQSELQHADARLKAAQDDLDALWGEHADVTESLAALRVQQAHEQAAQTALEREVARLGEARDGVQHELHAAADVLRDANVADEELPLCDTLRALLQALGESQARMHDAEVQCERAQAAEHMARAALGEMAGTRQGAIAELDLTLAEKQSELRDLSQRVAAAEQTARALDDAEAAARCTVEALEREAARMADEQALLASQQAQQEAEYTALQQDTVALQEERAEISESLEALRESTARLHAEVRHAAGVLHVPAEEVDVVSALRALVVACEASRAREHEAVAELAQALEMAKAYESRLASLSSLPEPVRRPSATPMDDAAMERERMAQEEDEEDRLPIAAPVPQYQRALPPTTVNPVTASLMRVKAQARELREPSLGRLTDAIASPARRTGWHATDGSVLTPRPLRNAPAASAPSQEVAARRGAVPPPTTSPMAAGQTPTLSRVLYYAQRTPRAQVSGSRHGTSDGAEEGRASASMHSAERSGSSVRWSAATVSGAPATWKTKMDELQSELRGLRSDLGANK